MELDVGTKSFGKEVLDAIKTGEAEEMREELRVHLVKGKWFIKGAEAIIAANPVYFDRTGTWWLWNSKLCSWEERDETDILVMCRGTLNLLGDTSVKHGSKLLEALRQVSRKQEPKEPPTNFIQFGTEFTDIKTGDRILSTPEYFSTNPISWNIGSSSATPVMDELIISWVGTEHLQTVYELIAYCCYRDYPIHRIFCFVGTGANGKTRLLKIIEKFVGNNNKASATLKKLVGNDFALYPLYRKLVCFVGETAHHGLENTEVIKALSGQDPVTFEAKGKNAFTGQNYAKLIVGTNVIPPSTDTSRGWYRRWFVLKFPNEFTEQEDVLQRIPEHEYENLAAKVIAILPMLLHRGGFATEGTIEERQAVYMDNSNPIKQFIAERYERVADSRVRYSECYLDYLNFLAGRKQRRISKKEFSAALEDEGLETQKTSTKDGMTGETMSFNVVWGLRKLPVQRTIPDIPDIPDVPDAPEIPLKDSGADRRVGHTEHTEHTAAINASVPSAPQETGISSGKGIIAYLRDKLPKLVSRDELLQALKVDTPDPAKWLDVRLAALKMNGDAYDPRPDQWTVLE